MPAKSNCEPVRAGCATPRSTGVGPAVDPADERQARSNWDLMSHESKPGPPARCGLTPGPKREWPIDGPCARRASGQLSPPRRGCSGLAYSVDYVTRRPFDETIETPGHVLHRCRQRAVPDRIDMDCRRRFTPLRVRKSDAKGACGCGESFTVGTPPGLRLYRRKAEMQARGLRPGHHWSGALYVRRDRFRSALPG